jgi:hypothetical protein
VLFRVPATRAEQEVIASPMASNLSSDEILSALERMNAAELEKLVPRVIALSAARRAPHLKPEESKLLARIDEGLPAELKSRLSALEEKRDNSGGWYLSGPGVAENTAAVNRSTRQSRFQ